MNDELVEFIDLDDLPHMGQSANQISAAIQKNEFSLHEKDRKRHKSAIWNIFREIKDGTGSPVNGFVCCNECKAVLSHEPAKLGTSNLNKHRCYRRHSGINASKCTGNIELQ